MNVTVHKADDYNILSLTLRDLGEVSLEIIEEISRSLEHAEDLREPTVLFISLMGQLTTSQAASWPGPIQISHINKWERILHRIERTDVFTVLSIAGPCSWLALELLLVSDRRIARRDMLISLPHMHQQIWPSMALYRLSRQLGEAATRSLLLRAQDIDLAMASDFKLLDEQLLEDCNVIDRLKEYIVTAPIRDFAIRRRLLQESSSLSYEESLGAHLAACDRTLRHRIHNFLDHPHEHDRTSPQTAKMAAKS